MLGNSDATPMLAVRDVARARDFYARLGFEGREEMGGEIVMLRGSNSDICLYRSEFAGTNQATAMSFTVDDIEAEMRELRKVGVSFEHYDVEGLAAKGDIYEGEGMKTAWFKDPDGNIMSLIEEN